MPVATLAAQRAAALLTPLATDRTAYRAVSDGLRLLVADGRIAVDTRLPSERDLAAALGLSRTTVTRAYALLVERGWARARQGSGTVAVLPPGAVRRGAGQALRPGDGRDDVIDLSCAALRATPGCARAYEQALQELPRYLSGTGYLTLGLPELRAAIADRYAARGLPTSPEQVLVTSGAMAGVGTAARALIGPGGRILLETPTFPNAVDTLRRSGIRMSTVPVDADGWDTGTVVSAVRAGVSAAYLIPDFHNPTGALMPDAQRAEIGAAITRAGVVTIVDETLVDTALDEPVAMPSPFAVHAPGAVTVGSSSKTHWGGLRVGWVRADPGVLERLVDARVSIDPGTAVAEQLVLLHLLREAPGLVEERRTAIRAARDALVDALRDRLPQVRFRVPTGGLCLWLELPTPDATEVALAAEDEGLLVAAGPRFAARGGHGRWLRMAYVSDPSTMLEAVERLGRAMDRTRSEASDPGPRRGVGRRHTGPLVA